VELTVPQTPDLVRTALADGVAVITLARPEKHNALSDAMVVQWRAAFAWAVTEPAANAILLRGEGRSFCSGRDTSELGHRRHGESDEEFLAAHQADTLARLDCPKPIVAAVQGAVIGGGFEIALSADVRIAATDARFALPEVRFGLIPDTGATTLLTALVGPARAKLVIAGGRTLDAPTALAWGAVDDVVPVEDLEDAAMAVARGFALLPPAAVRAAKAAVDQAWAAAHRAGLETELRSQIALFADRRHHPRAELQLE
jgi:enoyl-CoA hydratase/carnithine racemase